MHPASLLGELDADAAGPFRAHDPEFAAALGPDPRLVCEQGTRRSHARIGRLDRVTGAMETVVDQWRGLRPNSPNDVVVKRDGTIWFTDPSYGHLQDLFRRTKPDFDPSRTEGGRS